MNINEIKIEQNLKIALLRILHKEKLLTDEQFSSLINNNVLAKSPEKGGES